MLLSYRKIHTYTKSIPQYKKERQRRKQARTLEAEGLTRLQIAQKLGVSVRTVYRDLKKTEHYYMGQINRKWNQFHEQRQREFEAQMTGMSPFQQLNFLTDQIIKQQKLMCMREYLRKQIIFTIDMDDLTDGIPSIKRSFYTPSFKVHIPFTLNFRVRKDGELHSLGGMTIQRSSS